MRILLLLLLLLLACPAAAADYALLSPDGGTVLEVRSYPHELIEAEAVLSPARGKPWLRLIVNAEREPLGEDEQYGAPVIDCSADPCVRSWAVEPTPVPAEITPRQLRLQLLAMGLLDVVEAMIEQADPEMQIAWRYSTGIERASPIVAALAAELQLGDAEVDAAFRAAAKR